MFIFMQHVILHVLLELVVLHIVYKTKCYLQYHILYEIYDCVLQYVQISAYSHNLQINNKFIILYLHVSTIYQIQNMSIYMSLGLYMFNVLPCTYLQTFLQVIVPLFTFPE